MRKTLISIVIIFIFCFGIYYFYNDLTGDFRENNLSFDIPFNPQFVIADLSETDQRRVDQVLSQPFTWLDHGHQIYAFENPDKSYVLKIFKFKRLKPISFLRWFEQWPWIGFYLQKAEAKRVHRIEKLFTGYHLAYSQDKEQTGLLYVHLNKTDSLKRQVKVKDRLGFTHQLDLDQFYFAIQKKGRTTKAVLTELLEKNDVSQVNQHLSALIDMFVSEYQRGIVDWDHNIMHNTGFIGTKPIRLDIGQLQYDEKIKDPKNYREDLEKICSKRVIRWLKKHYPAQEPAITEHLRQKLRQGHIGLTGHMGQGL